MNRNWQKRRSFLHELGVSLAKPYMKSQIEIPESESSLSLLIPMNQSGQDPMTSSENSIADEAHSISPPLTLHRSKSVPPQLKGRARCQICIAGGSTYKNNLHRTICCLCHKACCKNIHNRNVCTKCFAKKLIYLIYVYSHEENLIFNSVFPFVSIWLRFLIGVHQQKWNEKTGFQQIYELCALYQFSCRKNDQNRPIRHRFLLIPVSMDLNFVRS